MNFLPDTGPLFLLLQFETGNKIPGTPVGYVKQPKSVRNKVNLTILVLCPLSHERTCFLPGDTCGLGTRLEVVSNQDPSSTLQEEREEAGSGYEIRLEVACTLTTVVTNLFTSTGKCYSKNQTLQGDRQQSGIIVLYLSSQGPQRV